MTKEEWFNLCVGDVLTMATPNDVSGVVGIYLILKLTEYQWSPFGPILERPDPRRVVRLKTFSSSTMKTTEWHLEQDRALRMWLVLKRE
jgi:hypothetical protein